MNHSIIKLRDLDPNNLSFRLYTSPNHVGLNLHFTCSNNRSEYYQTFNMSKPFQEDRSIRIKNIPEVDVSDWYWFQLDPRDDQSLQKLIRKYQEENPDVRLQLYTRHNQEIRRVKCILSPGMKLFVKFGEDQIYNVDKIKFKDLLANQLADYLKYATINKIYFTSLKGKTFYLKMKILQIKFEIDYEVIKKESKKKSHNQVNLSKVSSSQNGTVLPDEIWDQIQEDLENKIKSELEVQIKKDLKTLFEIDD